MPLRKKKITLAPKKGPLQVSSEKKKKYIRNPSIPIPRIQIPVRAAFKPKPRFPPYDGTGLYKCVGLTPKEKMHVIGTCQTRSARFSQLKTLASEAITNNRIFSVYGNGKAVRDALTERGWVEKLPVRRMNTKKIQNGRIASHEDRNELETLLLSHFVEQYAPSFIWYSKERKNRKDSVIEVTKDYVPIINKLQKDAQWTTKQGLCSTMKRNYWFYIEGVAEVDCPRTYDSCDHSEVEVDSFRNDFKITACTSLLKWVLSMVFKDRPVFISDGTVSINVILFAINRCKEYLYSKQNKDIDKTLSNVSSGQWKTFLKHYSGIISKNKYFKLEKQKHLSLYLSYAKFILKEIHKYRPQLSCEGCHNIWIVKPGFLCRGVGIKLTSRLEEIDEILNKTQANYVLQKYIEEPLIVHETKFDIRQYYLITSTSPLVIWMYKDCYLKFCSQKYNLRNYHESIHLTNNAVQRKYKNCENRAKELPLANMWHSDSFKDYLEKKGQKNVWDTIIYPGMRKAIVSIVLGCQDSLIQCKNRFELYGCDFLLDNDYKPWLIEINSGPDLNHTTPVTANICPAVIRDVIKVVIDYARDKSCPTGNFECIYRQPYTLPRSVGGELTVRGYSLPESYFYKGKYEPKEPLHDATCNQLDVGLVMRLMKETYYNTPSLYRKDSDENLNVSESNHVQKCSSKVAKISKAYFAKRLLNAIECSMSVLKGEKPNQSVIDIYSEQNNKDSDTPELEGRVDLRPLEEALLELSPSTQMLNPHIDCDNIQPKAKLKRRDKTSRPVFNIFDFSHKNETEETECDLFIKMQHKIYKNHTYGI